MNFVQNIKAFLGKIEKFISYFLSVSLGNQEFENFKKIKLCQKSMKP